MTTSKSKEIIEEWLSELEGFSIRKERLIDAVGIENYEAVKTWLVAAYGLAKIEPAEIAE